jgi:hypothetical protein
VRAKALGIDDDRQARPGISERSLARLAAYLHRLRRLPSKLRSGLGIDSLYTPAAITPAQSELIRRLGLAPQRRSI